MLVSQRRPPSSPGLGFACGAVRSFLGPLQAPAWLFPPASNVFLNAAARSPRTFPSTQSPFMSCRHSGPAEGLLRLQRKTIRTIKIFLPRPSPVGDRPCGDTCDRSDSGPQDSVSGQGRGQPEAAPDHKQGFRAAMWGLQSLRPLALVCRAGLAGCTGRPKS